MLVERWQVSWGHPGMLCGEREGAKSLLPGLAVLKERFGSVLGKRCMKGELKHEGQRRMES